jgi:hypothetical protein
VIKLLRINEASEEMSEIGESKKIIPEQETKNMETHASHLPHPPGEKYGITFPNS